MIELLGSWARPLATMVGLVLLWQALVWLTGVPPYLLPTPSSVATVFATRAWLLAIHTSATALEIVLGLAIGAACGMAAALLLAAFSGARRWLLPLIITSQSIPVFALAPLLVLWLGYGLPSKVTMAVLIIFFPVTAAFYDGLRRTAPGWLELAATMDAAPGAVLWQIRLPAAAPALASGLRMAAAVAPIGAVIGEWVGASRGLGFLMLQANGRMQTDLMFAALIVLCGLAVLTWVLMDRSMRALIRWQPDTLSPST